MVLAIRREGSKVIFKFPTVLNRYFTFAIERGDEVDAALLAADMNARLDAAVQTARRDAYTQGWRDAKAKKSGKSDWFSRVLDVQ